MILHPCDNIIDKFLNLLERNIKWTLCWFENNEVKLNTDKCHLIISGYTHKQVWAQVGEDKIWESAYVKLLGVTIDKDLKFEQHVLKMCSKAIRKLSMFVARISKFLTFKNQRNIFKMFVE